MMHQSANVLLLVFQRPEISLSVLLLQLGYTLLKVAIYGNYTGSLNKLFFSLLKKLTLRWELQFRFSFCSYLISVSDQYPQFACLVICAGIMYNGFFFLIFILLLLGWHEILPPFGQFHIQVITSEFMGIEIFWGVCSDQCSSLAGLQLQKWR